MATPPGGDILAEGGWSAETDPGAATATTDPVVTPQKKMRAKVQGPEGGPTSRATADDHLSGSWRLGTGTGTGTGTGGGLFALRATGS